MSSKRLPVLLLVLAVIVIVANAETPPKDHLLSWPNLRQVASLRFIGIPPAKR